MPVLRLDDVFVTQLLSLNERHLPFEDMIESVRSVREQVDWASVGRRTDSSPFARAFLTMVAELGLIATA